MNVRLANLHNFFPRKKNKQIPPLYRSYNNAKKGNAKIPPNLVKLTRQFVFLEGEKSARGEKKGEEKEDEEEELPGTP